MSDTISLAKEEQAVIDALEKLNVIQLNNVVKFMEKQYGISAAAPAAVAAAPAAAAGAGEEEKSSYEIELTESGAQKIAVIKIVREVTQLGLGEAKALVDKAPTIIKKDVSKKDADEMKKKLEEAGAKITLK